VNTVGKPDEGKPHVRIDEGVLETERWAARGGHSPKRGETAWPRTPCTPPRQCSTLLVVLSNGTSAQTEAFREELYQTEGFQFLGFQIDRRVGQKGTLVPRIRIPKSSQKRLLDKLMRMLAPNTHEDAVNAKFAAINKGIGGWCHSYQHSSGPARTFSRLSNRIFWFVAHWLGRKYQRSIAKVMHKFYTNGVFQTNSMTLVLPQRYQPKRYKLSVTPNPYTHNIVSERAELPQRDTVWIGGRDRNADIRAEVRETRGPICSYCGATLEWSQLHVDHK